MPTKEIACCVLASTDADYARFEQAPLVNVNETSEPFTFLWLSFIAFPGLRASPGNIVVGDATNGCCAVVQSKRRVHLVLRCAKFISIDGVSS